MAILILNRLPLDAVGYAEVLSDATGPLVLLSAAEDTDPATLQAHGHEFAHVELLAFERDGLVEERAEALHARSPFDRIVAVSEDDLLLAGALRARLGVEGQSLESARAFRDKLAMKDAARLGGIAVPAARPVDSPADVRRFVDEHGFSAVVKPVLGAGARDTTVITDRADLAAWERRPPSIAPVEVEAFVDGPMYHVDGFVQDGAVVACWCSRYAGDCLGFVSGAPQGSYTVPPDDPVVSRLRSFTTRLLAALPTPDVTAFHAEAFEPDGDELVLCEVASRVAGPMVPEQLAVAFGVDLRRAHIRGQAGLPVHLPPREIREVPRVLAAELVIPRRRGRLARAPGACPLPGLVHYRIHADVGAVLDAPADINDYIASFVLQGRTEEEIVERLAGAVRWFDGACAWEDA